MEIGGTILEVLYTLGKMVPRPLEGPYVWANRIKNIEKGQYYRSLRHLKQRGLVKIISKKDQRFIKLTASGQLEALLVMAKVPVKEKWDGKWRLLIFDIPEASRSKRKLFRSLLKANGFYRLQASVYISPYSLNRQAINYLQQCKLMEYIRILRIEELDNDVEIKKYFNLN